MSSLMIDIEGLGTGPDATILTIAAQSFDPFGNGYYDRCYYARITLESQENRAIEQGTLDWWSTQKEAQAEAFMEEGRVPLDQALDSLYKLAWQHKFIFANGPTYDMNILEHAYKSLNMALPWRYFSVRDSRTVFSLVPSLAKYPASHHALEDCRRQCNLLWDSLEYLRVRELA
jgi:hypothetical protein